MTSHVVGEIALCHTLRVLNRSSHVQSLYPALTVHS